MIIDFILSAGAVSVLYAAFICIVYIGWSDKTAWLTKKRLRLLISASPFVGTIVVSLWWNTSIRSAQRPTRVVPEIRKEQADVPASNTETVAERNKREQERLDRERDAHKEAFKKTREQ